MSKWSSRGKEWNELRDIQLARFNYECALCGSDGNGKPLQLDHIIPASKGGTNTLENTRILCQTCNGKKGDRAAAQDKPFVNPRWFAQGMLKRPGS